MQKEKLCGVYCIENIANNKKYIGLSCDITRRWHEHLSDLRRNVHINTCLQNAWNKYGEDLFVFYILELCESNELIDKESYYIKQYHTLTHECGYNITPGGECNTTNCKPIINLLNEYIYSSIAEAMSELNVSYPTITNWCKSRRNYMYLEEYNNLSNEERAYLKKFDWDKFDRERRSCAHSRQNLSSETLEKLSLATSGANNPRAFSVYCPELDEIFWGAKEAAEKYGISRSSISQCINGHLNTAGKHPITQEPLTWFKL